MSRADHAKAEAPGEVWEDLIPPPGELPFRPWWWHPSRYKGRHRGSFAYWAKARAIPFGVRSVRIRPYIEVLTQGVAGPGTGPHPVGVDSEGKAYKQDMPNSQTIGFSTFEPFAGDGYTGGVVVP